MRVRVRFQVGVGLIGCIKDGNSFFLQVSMCPFAVEE